MISEISSSENATILIRQIKKYFSKHYTRAHYNGAARMVCYFGENYTKLDEEYQKHPEKDNVCPGLIRILFQDDRPEGIRDLVTKTLADYPAIVIVEITEGKDWQQPERNEMRVVLSCDHSAFCFDDLKRIMLELNGNQKADAFKTKLVLAAMTYHDPLTGPQKTAIHICVENPWQCWIGRENEFSGNRIIIWPEK
ncbi:MAG: hypothetical protein IKV50_05890 [Clostridia bacterium]|nr:hypothetical protein [Clostridia bacterium]